MTDIKIKSGKFVEMEVPGRDGPQVVLIGRIADDSLGHLKVDRYQRERRTKSQLYQMVSALESGEVLPVIDLGLRGSNYHKQGQDTYVLRGECYVIDGLQRSTATMLYLDKHPQNTVDLLAMVHFGTDEPFERKRFDRLNNTPKKVSATKRLFNTGLDDEHRAVMTLIGLSNNDREFPLYKKVAWDQTMHRDKLINGVVLTTVANSLHHHVSAAASVDRIHNMANKAQVIADTIGLYQFRENVKTFFTLIEKVYGISNVQYRSATPYLRKRFLSVLALLLSDHIDFWRGKNDNELFIPMDHRRKLASFPYDDPHVAALCSGGNIANKMLYSLIEDHLNKGKSKNRLTKRTAVISAFANDDEGLLAMEAAE